MGAVLQCVVAVCYNVLQCVVRDVCMCVCFSVFCGVCKPCCSVLQCVAVSCRVLQSVAVCCSVLQCVVLCGSLF